MYKTIFGLLPFAGNYSHDFRLMRTNWICQCKTARKEKKYILFRKCEVYKDIRENLYDPGQFFTGSPGKEGAA